MYVIERGKLQLSSVVGGSKVLICTMNAPCVVGEEVLAGESY